MIITVQQIAAFTATKELLKAYATVARQKSLAIFQSLTPADLEREVTSVKGKKMMTERYLKSLIFDYIHHAGQIAYLRVYLKGRWDPPYTLRSTARL